MKPKKQDPIVDSPRFRFGLIGAMFGFVLALWQCTGYLAIDATTVLGISLLGVALFACIGVGWHIVLTSIDSFEPSSKRYVYFFTARIALAGLVIAVIAFQYSYGYIFAQQFLRLIAVAMTGVLIVSFIWLINSAVVSMQANSKIQRQLNYEAHMRRKARYKRSVDLNKQDYETRLSQFVAHANDSDAPNDSNASTDYAPTDSTDFDSSNELDDLEMDERFVSRMPFWQRSQFQFGKLPKPTDLIRVLLHRISKAVYQGKGS